MDVVEVPKAHESNHPTTVDLIKEGTVNAVVNTIEGDKDALADAFEIRRAAVEARIPCFTSIDTARVAVESLVNSGGEFNILPMNEYSS